MLTRILGRKSKSAAQSAQCAPASRFSRLRLETLEDRTTPATLDYTGLVPSNIMNQYNWWEPQSHYYATPTEWDDLVFVGAQPSGDTTYLPPPITATPGSMEYQMMVMMGVPVNQPLHPNADVTIPLGSLPSVRGVQLISNYTGHVSVDNGQTIGTLDLRTGNLDQIGYNSNLTISTQLQFLGGTLNSTSYTGGVVHITGNGYTPGPAHANLLPPDGGALTLGSTLSVEGLPNGVGGAGMAIYVGDYIIKNGADINTNAYCAVEVGRGLPPNQPPPPLTVLHSATNFNVETVGAGAKEYSAFNVLAQGNCIFVGDFEGKAKVLISAGGWGRIAADVTVTLSDPVDANALSSVEIDKSDDVDSAAIFEMYTGSKLVAPNGVGARGRFRTIAPRSGVVEVIGNIRVGSEGSLDVSYNYYFAPPNTHEQFNYLNVTGSISVFGGRVAVSVDGNVDGENYPTSESTDGDSIHTTKFFSFAEGSKLEVRVANPVSNTLLRPGRTWDIISSADTIDGTVPDPLGMSDLTASKLAPGNDIVQVKVK